MGSYKMGCGCLPVPQQEVDICSVTVPSHYCKTDDVKRLGEAVKLILECLCDLKDQCIYTPLPPIVVDSFTGQTLELDGLVDADTLMYFEADDSLKHIYWNGQRLAATNGTGIRDFTIDGSAITFLKSQEDCRIIIDIFKCTKLK